MEQIDLKLKLFGGQSIDLEGYGDIKPLTIQEIINFGYTNYLKSLNILCLTIEDLLNGEKVEDDDLDKLCVLDVLIKKGGFEIHNELEVAFSFLLHGDALVDEDNLSVLIRKNNDEDIRIVNRDNFNEILEIIKFQNYINHFEDKELDTLNDSEETKKFKERMRRIQKQRDEIKKKQEGGNDDEENNVDFYDILSSISSKSNSIDEISVLNLTIYQVYKKFKRIDVLDQYDISIKSIMAGATKIKLKHWSSKV